MSEIEKLLEIMASLRDQASGCPWDLAQDFASVAPYTIEEAYEVADAIHKNDLHGLRDELGDLLFQVVFHARMASELGAFDFNDVAAAINAKMLRRHPHVFGSEEEKAAGQSAGAWEDLKAAERAKVACEDNSALAGVPVALPALKRAQKLGKRAATVGFDWKDTGGVRAKIAEELAELSAAECAGQREQMEEELGDVLFAVTNLARHLQIDAENALEQANRKFEKRFRTMEEDLDEAGEQLGKLDIAAMEARWQTAKTRV